MRYGRNAGRPAPDFRAAQNARYPGEAEEKTHPPVRVSYRVITRYPPSQTLLPSSGGVRWRDDVETGTNRGALYAHRPQGQKTEVRLIPALRRDAPCPRILTVDLGGGGRYLTRGTARCSERNRPTCGSVATPAAMGGLTTRSAGMPKRGIDRIGYPHDCAPERAAIAAAGAHGKGDDVSRMTAWGVQKGGHAR